MPTIAITVNGSRREAEAEPRTLLVDFLRENLGLTGTKVGCEQGVCGACTVQLDGVPSRSCSIPVSAVGARHVVTIEGLAPAAGANGQTLHPVQAAWIAEQVPQCGYCQSGQLMAAAALLAAHPHPTDAQIDAAMTNICRCGTYGRIRAAVHRAAKEMAERPATARTATGTDKEHRT